jgi:hypothetical protein
MISRAATLDAGQEKAGGPKEAKIAGGMQKFSSFHIESAGLK